MIRPPVVSLAVSSAAVAEDGAANLTYTFTRTGTTAAPLTVNYGIAGTATQGTDYTVVGGTPGTVTFAAGAATATVTVDPTPDTTVEPDETVVLKLAAGTGYNIGTAAAVVTTITNDDVALPVTPRTVPGMPTGVMGVPGDGNVSLAWTAPASDGGAAISDYVMEVSSNAGGTWTTFADGVSTATSTTLTGLTNGTSYVFRVAAVNAAGTGATSVASAAFTPLPPPQAPTGVTVVSSTDSSVTLSWADVAGESDYRIERSSDFVTWTAVGSRAANTTTFTDNELEDGARYGYRVIALNSAGASAPGTVVTAETPLRAPGSVAATAVDGGRIALTWVDRSSRRPYFVVEQFVHPSLPWVPIGGADAGSSGMTVAGSFLPNMLYQFRVRAVTMSGSSWSGYTYGSSDPVPASVTTPAFPRVPSGLTATAVGSGVRVSWQPQANVSVIVERKPAGGDWTAVTTITSAVSSFNDSTVDPSTSYAYRIAFRNAHGTSGYSPSVSVVTAAGPNVRAAYRSTSSVFVRWASPPGSVTGVSLERTTSGSDAWTAIATLAGSVTDFSDTAVVPGTSYRYRTTFALSAGQPVIVTSAETGPEPTDADGDQLTGGEELAIGTNPYAFSTDSDLLGDGFERSNGLNPLSADENGNGVSDQYDDFDGDGLATWQEAAYGTSTSRADRNGDGRPDGFDSDGDGVSDGVEVQQGSAPSSALDKGEAASADSTIKLRLTIGDPSTSNSEQWALRVGAVRHVAPTHGSVVTTEYAFDVGKSYPISLEHLGTKFDTPDYDWYANIEKVDRPEFFVIDQNKPLYIIGPYRGGWMSWGGANYASLEAWLHVPALDADVDSNNDSGFAVPDDNPAEDRKENDGTTGKLVFVGAADLVPMAVRLSDNVKEARPTSIKVFFDYDPTVFRLWKNAGTARTPSDIIPAGTWVNADALGLAPGSDPTVYVEALEGTSGAMPITTSVKVEGARWSGTLKDTVHLVPVELDLILDGLPEESAPPPNELSPGAELPIGGGRTRLDIVVQSPANAGTVTLTVLSGADKITLWDAEEGGQQVQPGVWPVGQHPRTLWVEDTGLEGDFQLVAMFQNKGVNKQDATKGKVRTAEWSTAGEIKNGNQDGTNRITPKVESLTYQVDVDLETGDPAGVRPPGGPDDNALKGTAERLNKWVDGFAAQAGLGKDDEGRQFVGLFNPDPNEENLPKLASQFIKPSVKQPQNQDFQRIGNAMREGEMRNNIWRIELVPVVDPWEWNATITLPEWKQFTTDADQLNPGVKKQWENFVDALAGHEKIHKEKWQQYVRQYQDRVDVFAKTRFFGEAADPNDRTAKVSAWNNAIRLFETELKKLQADLKALTVTYNEDQKLYDRLSDHGRNQEGYDPAAGRNTKAVEDGFRLKR